MTIQPMRVRVTRTKQTDDGILGALSLSWDPFTCFTVENKSMSIPSGTFPLEFTYSPKFNRQMPLIDVPGREGVRIHPANTPGELEGCIAVGDKQEPDAVDNSRATFNQLWAKISGRTGLQIEIVENYGNLGGNYA